MMIIKNTMLAIKPPVIKRENLAFLKNGKEGEIKHSLFITLKNSYSVITYVLFFHNKNGHSNDLKRLGYIIRIISIL